MNTDSFYPDMSYKSVPLPEDLEKIKFHGDFEEAQRCISLWLKRKIPHALRRRLEAEAGIIDLLSHDEYPHTMEAAQRLMAENIRDYQAGELIALKDAGRADWMYVKGQVHFHRRFFENLTRSGTDYAARLIKSPEDSRDADNTQANAHANATVNAQERLNDNIRQMKTRGERSAEIRLRATLKVKKEFEEPGRTVLVHLPIPAETPEISAFKVERSSPADLLIAPPHVPQRTAAFKTLLKGGEVFSLEYSFINRIRYVDLGAPEKAQADSIVPRGSLRGRPQGQFLGEQLPHIRFTPYLRLLLEEILAGERAPLQKARRIYDFITTEVVYSYVREYAAIENISQYAAVNLKGDCGVQAILFITLCRMAGIPAAWQSGLYVTPDHAGCHDWAEFYVEPWGWLFADPSFGGGAWRKGDTERWNYYFGNLDVFRMPANSAILTDFSPPKKHPRADPVDNQTGELEYEDRGLPSYALETTQEIISFR
ncbi:MAG: transglutaminase-like domain-containing protein [Spirochaetaceae bacterium]|jgi:transglutaminase-like putative cysteine protease|nr:transglutaminase-like domain-containing protein [Spirochaetaceae bacterium]